MGRENNPSVYEPYGLELIVDDREVERRAGNHITANGGIIMFLPNWVARDFCKPGRRLKLNKKDLYAMDGIRGLDERWFGSTTPADNADLTLQNEGLSGFALADGKSMVRFIDAVGMLGALIIGQRLARQYDNKWPMYSKFFDNLAALPHHIHHDDKAAALVGQMGKPEAYFFPSQLNNFSDGLFPHTFFGLNPGTTKEQLIACLKRFHLGDNEITALARSYELQVNTGWDVPPGILHAPGSLCTYEPQKASDVFAMYQSLTQDKAKVPWGLLWKDTPDQYWKDKAPHEISDEAYELLANRLNWQLNLDPKFKEHRFMIPVPVGDMAAMKRDGYIEEWICYRSADFDAKRLAVLPGKEVMIQDKGAYGFIVLQGHGTIKGLDGPKIQIESPAEIFYGQPTQDEGFVTDKAARQGVLISNPSRMDPIVMLKHRGPGYSDLNRTEVYKQNLEIQRAGR